MTRANPAQEIASDGDAARRFPGVTETGGMTGVLPLETAPGRKAGGLFRVVALPVLDCPRCGYPHVPSMADPRCGACLRFLRQRQERRKERAAEYWAEFVARRSEAPK